MNTKKMVLAVVAVFLMWWMFKDPDGLAGAAGAAAGQVWSVTEQVFRAVIDFVGALT